MYPKPLLAQGYINFVRIYATCRRQTDGQTILDQKNRLVCPSVRFVMKFVILTSFGPGTNTIETQLVVQGWYIKVVRMSAKPRST